MADFTTFNDTDSPENTNIADGSDPTKKAKVSSNGDVGTSDILDSNTSIEGTITVGTSAVELKIGASALANRKFASIDNSSNVTIYWGFTSGVTTTTGERIYKDSKARWRVGPNQKIYLIAGTAGNVVRGKEGA
jgi:hypothetical protein